MHEETGLVVSNLVTAGAFVYRAADAASGLIEHEMNHVFVAVTESWVSTRQQEVADIVRLSYREAKRLVCSDRGAPWAAEVLSRSFDILNKQYIWNEQDDDTAGNR
jgi:isopentenyl-diphosphate delta-isomerase